MHESTHNEKKRKISQSTASLKRLRTTNLAPPLSADKILNLEAELSDSLQQQRKYNNILILLRAAKKECKIRNGEYTALFALCRIFCRLQANGRLSKTSVGSDNEAVLLDWLRQRYVEYKNTLSLLVARPSSRSAEVALHLALQLIKEESNSVSSSTSIFTKGFFAQFILAALNAGKDDKFWAVFAEDYANKYEDVRHFTFYLIDQALHDPDAVPNPKLTQSALQTLSLIRSDTSEESGEHTFFSRKLRQSKSLSLITQRKLAQQAWITLLNAKLDGSQRKAVLEVMTSRVVPWFQNVELLMDFLIDSFDVGGATSLLALSGLFHLIQSKNLDYPGFFSKLYSLINLELMFSKHRSRFFRLLNIFMASTHLPSALVASFVKRLSRLTLESPPAAIVAVIPWTYNMLKAHPACTFMLHREYLQIETDELAKYGTSDPFNPLEEDPMITNAIDSSLWELETLQSHYHPNVASLANIISEQFTKGSYHLEDFLDHSYASLVRSDLARGLKVAPVVEYKIPKSIFEEISDSDGLAAVFHI